MSGHSKFSNIKHRKEQQGVKRSKLFLNFLKKIKNEAKINNDPKKNPNLARLIERAHKANVPKDKIQKILNNKNSLNDYKEILYEGFIDKNITFIILCFTDNVNRTSSLIKSFFTKCNGHLGTNNSVVHNYNYYMLVNCSSKYITDKILDNIILSTKLVDYEIANNEYNFFYLKQNFVNDKQHFVDKNILINKEEIIYKPIYKSENISFNTKKNIEKFISLLDLCEDVQIFWTNI